MSPAEIRVADLTVSHQRRPAVHHLSGRFAPGSLTAVVGPNGAGKSTLLRVLCGLTAPSRGEVRILGQVPRRDLALNRRIGLVPQQEALFDPLRAVQFVRLAAELHGVADPGAAAVAALALVDLDPDDVRPVRTYSKGMRQRVKVAAALVHGPEVVLLDEPLTALDRGLRERLASDLRDILLASGTTAMLVTHDHEEAFAVADRMAVMRAGRIVQSGTLEEVWRHPADPETARFLGYATVLSGPAAAYVWSRAGGTAADPAPVLALRRSALRVRPVEDGSPPAGSGVVTAARLTPDRWRVVVELPEVGRLDAVADTTVPIRAGQRVAVYFDPALMARLE